jgi:hypothetical protein
MVYIASDGSLADTKKRKWGLSIIRDFIVGIFDFIGLFFRTLTASPTTLENERVSVLFLLLYPLYAFCVHISQFIRRVIMYINDYILLYLIHCFIRINNILNHFYIIGTTTYHIRTTSRCTTWGEWQ